MQHHSHAIRRNRMPPVLLVGTPIPSLPIGPPSQMQHLVLERDALALQTAELQAAAQAHADLQVAYAVEREQRVAEQALAQRLDMEPGASSTYWCCRCCCFKHSEI
jgi:hypothetical protein